MEIRYPFVIVIVLIIFICSFMVFKKKINVYKKGSKIANTEYLKNTNYYKKKIREYNFAKKILLTLFCIAIICSTILVSRLAKIETSNINQYNRDIFLCMDVSRSVDELNLELIQSLKNVVNKLHGERFGISIFNTSSVVLIPLTDDYDYVIEVLDEMEDSIKLINSSNPSKYYDDSYYSTLGYIYLGTIEGNETRGSSLIGDGLASCVYSFSNLEEDRTRIIIFSTDNDLQGTPIVTLDTASKISKSKGVKVFGIGTKDMKKTAKDSLREASLKTGGKFYEHSKSTVNDIVNNIEETSKSLLDNQIETKELDIPKIPFIILLISLVGIVIFSKKVAK